MIAHPTSEAARRLSASLALAVQLLAVVALPFAEHAHDHEFQLGVEWHAEHGSEEHGSHALGDCPLLCSLASAGPLTAPPTGVTASSTVVSPSMLAPERVRPAIHATSVTARGPPQA